VNKSQHLAAITGLSAVIYIVTVFLPMTASAGCTVSHLECEYPCIEYYPNGVDCKKTKKICKTVCDDFDVKPSGNTPHRGFSLQDFQQKKGVAIMQIIKGILHRVGAIGGETTGWAIRLDSPLKVTETMKVKKIEVDADHSLLEPLLDKRVDARGRITWRRDIERGRYPVMMLDWIRKH